MSPLSKLLTETWFSACRFGLWVVLLLSVATTAFAEQAQQVSQYGITWKFDKPYTVGKFITGDYWVVGPVNVVSVTPTPGPAAANEKVAQAKSRYGATALHDDKQMRNGSMIVTGTEPAPKGGARFSGQGYDSRGLGYVPELSVAFPLQLPVNRTLISSVSSETCGADGKPVAPFVLDGLGLMFCPPTAQSVMRAAAVLTCLDKAPPNDAFRPPYAGTEKPIYQLKDLHWEILPKLNPPSSTPNWAKMERVFERPWPDHLCTWAYQFCFPAENEPGYGREFGRMTSIAGLMLLLDVPQQKKEKLMIEYVQLGIDLHGLAAIGRHWVSEEGGHWIGRKWPILFASLMLNNESLRTFPVTDSSVYQLQPQTPAPRGLFCEDTDTYYGKGGNGQTVLGQVTVHGEARLPFEEKPRAQFDKTDAWLDGYRTQNAVSWNGEALAALLMKAKAIWNHDAYFDYVDRMMGPNASTDFPKFLPKGCTRSLDLFTDEMWKMYRKSAPEQPGGKENLKWVWNADKHFGHFEDNPKGTGAPQPGPGDKAEKAWPFH